MTGRSNELSASDLAQLAETSWVIADGARAYAAGKSRSQSPWPNGTYFSDCWYEGFDAARLMRDKLRIKTCNQRRVYKHAAAPVCQLCAGTGKLDVDGSGVPGKCPACADRELYASSADRQRQTCPTCGK